LGGKSYTQTELLTILNTPVRGDASVNLAHQLIAADLNRATGSQFVPDPIGPTITTADVLVAFACNTVGKLPCGVTAKSNPVVYQSMVNVAATLDAFNSGTLTPICTQRGG
jgi:hypothetical protein